MKMAWRSPGENARKEYTHDLYVDPRFPNDDDTVWAKWPDKYCCSVLDITVGELKDMKTVESKVSKGLLWSGKLHGTGDRLSIVKRKDHFMIFKLQHHVEGKCKQICMIRCDAMGEEGESKTLDLFLQVAETLQI